MSTIQALGLSPEAAEAVQRKAQAAQMTLSEYIRHLVETDTGSPSPWEGYRDLLVSGEPPAPIGDAVLDDVAEFRDSITGEVTTESVLTAVREERGE